MDKTPDNDLFREIFNVIPVGLILLDEGHSIVAWNNWMTTYTKIGLKDALGEKFESLFPEPKRLRFSWALDQVLNQKNPQVLSTTLNQYIIPIKLNKDYFGEMEMMQQDVEILPVTHEERNFALIVVQDVSIKTHLKKTLINIAAKFEKSSMIDTLTGCYNRRFLFKYLETELENAERAQFNVVCCLFDLDHFKKINDELGHLAGDDVLISFAKITTKLLRGRDYFFRYGGEEFVAVLSRIKIEDARKVVNRIRSVFENTTTHGRVQRKITCSGGLSYWTPDQPTISGEKLINLADIQLYKAKNEGRNCFAMDNEIF